MSIGHLSLGFLRRRDLVVEDPAPRIALAPANATHLRLLQRSSLRSDDIDKK